jgi:hypothetical protein
VLDAAPRPGTIDALCIEARDARERCDMAPIDFMKDWRSLFGAHFAMHSFLARCGAFLFALSA